MTFAYCQCRFANCLLLNASCYLLIAFCYFPIVFCSLLIENCLFSLYTLSFASMSIEDQYKELLRSLHCYLWKKNKCAFQRFDAQI